ncbi:MAG: hypothetical protein FWH17_03940 [Oscillospiraceae bacterium]|nr:hypothetical protein [Oscillospiraceae bacterium]
MKENETVVFEEVLENEIDDLWDIFFPYMSEKEDGAGKTKKSEKTKPRRYLRFLTM